MTRDAMIEIKALKRITLFLSVFLCTACATTPHARSSVSLTQPRLSSQSSNPRDLLRVNSIAVAPVQLDRRLLAYEATRLGLSADVEAAAREELSLKVFLLDRGKQGQLDTCEPLMCGKKLRADAVLITRLLQFVPREGSSVGVTVPASIGFELSLQRVSDGKSVWAASYFAKDEALSENLFHIEDKLSDPRGPRWRSERELFGAGVREALRDLATKRIAQFSAESPQ